MHDFHIKVSNLGMSNHEVNPHIDMVYKVMLGLR